MTHYLGIDIGGTKIAGVVLTASHDVVRESQIETPRDDYTCFLMHSLDSWALLIKAKGYR